jgi:hypothetical protein
MAEQDQPATCGQGLAHNAVVPTLLAEVAARLAANLEVHATALDLDDRASAREHAVYQEVAESLRDGAADLEAAGASMLGARDLPMGRHDMAVMTSPPVLDAFERYVAAAGELRTLLEARANADAAMLAQIRKAVGNDG